MIKKIILILIFLIFNFGKSQIEKNYGDTPEPVPSASSFSSYVNTPVALSTGIPNINIPLLTLPTGKKNFQLTTELNYHVYNTGLNKPASEVGLGWTLFKGGGVISRVINDVVDECNYNTSKSTYKKNLFDDIYYYDIPGSSGKFKFVRDTINNTFSINNISGNNIKIEYTRDSNTATLILNTFKITDSKGFKYVFEDYSISRYDTSYNGFNYKSAFYLTRILDENDLVIANFNYLKDTKYTGGTILLYQNCKLESVSTQFGKVTYENVLSNNGDDDPDIIKSVSLWDMKSHLISKYRFNYNFFNSTLYPGNYNQGKRILYSLDKLNKNQEVIERRDFSYDESGSEKLYGPALNNEKYGNFLCPVASQVNPKTYTVGLLKKMTLPEGGSIVYNFEANEVYENKSNLQLNYDDITDPDIQYMNLNNSINFDTNTNRNYTFQLSGTKKVWVKLSINETYEIPKPPHGSIIIDPEYKLLNSSGIAVAGYTTGCSNLVKYYNLTPGTYTFQVFRGNGNGVIENYVIANLPAPYKNRIQTKLGARIANIKYYDTDNTVKKSVSYQYDLFDNTGSSGEGFTGEVCNDELGYSNGTILYKNVKETYEGASENIGYSKYYFKVPTDYTSAILFYKPYINIVSSGLLSKKEMFNQQNQMISRESTEYVLEEIPNVAEYVLCGTYKSKSSWMKSMATTSTMYYANGSSIENKSETTFNLSNFQPALVKMTSSDGKITEQSIKYAADLSNTRLMNANMLSIPLQTEVKVNGSTVSKGETKYNLPSSLYPSSVVAYNMQNQNAVTTTVFNEYDNKGNLLQITGKNNIPVTTIWGYYQTQPIAQIAGVTYSQVSNLPSVLAAIAASNADADDPANEASLLTALDNLRNDTALQSQSVSVSTYDPLVGTTNTISPNGIKTTYSYDRNNRLVKTMDSNGKTLNEYQYNYRHN